MVHIMQNDSMLAMFVASYNALIESHSIPFVAADIISYIHNCQLQITVLCASMSYALCLTFTM